MNVQPKTQASTKQICHPCKNLQHPTEPYKARFGPKPDHSKQLFEHQASTVSVARQPRSVHWEVSAARSPVLAVSLRLEGVWGPKLTPISFGSKFGGKTVRRPLGRRSSHPSMTSSVSTWLFQEPENRLSIWLRRTACKRP